jgi:regulation of enolase protein 1 (concanavalin A-like superfamily)
MLPVLALALLSPAAPVPKETEKDRIEKLYGKPDGENKSVLALDRDVLVMRFPKWEGKGSAKDTPSRLLREIRGSFQAEVLVRYELPAKVGRKGAFAIFGGGLGVRSDDGTAFQLGIYHNNMHRFHNGQKADLNHLIESWTSVPKVGAKQVQTASQLDGQPAVEAPFRIRLTRAAGKVRGEYLHGKEWVQWHEIEDSFPVAVRVGVHAANHSTEPFEIRFSDFTITPLKEKK